MNFLQEQSANIVTDVLAYFAPRIDEEPALLLRQVESELDSLYIRYGNDWTGRGYVGDSQQEATIAALEAVRAECLSRLHKRSYG
ncbi:hypothetical protein SAMN02745165_01389 [Malonomonas rubra DSM 5091]|uniref:Uncharacterized protein n=1 Tax=Malonomonas rubra DSM 5091 TaxID=1122189 RepID=A0A1M6G3F5_MALRU|nr:hypothetical protein [Malonomonas rubra]SHJ04444.1 hypothetical protein SAMN02745165_01389 [Malonomonas rubra DSM 5091]